MRLNPLAQRRVGRHEQNAAGAENQNQDIKHARPSRVNSQGTLINAKVDKHAMYTLTN